MYKYFYIRIRIIQHTNTHSNIHVVSKQIKYSPLHALQINNVQEENRRNVRMVLSTL